MELNTNSSQRQFKACRLATPARWNSQQDRQGKQIGRSPLFTGFKLPASRFSRGMGSLLLAGFALIAGVGADARLLPAQAGTCASNCGPAPLSFVPGDYVEVTITNLTNSLIEVQEPGGTDSIPVYPGRRILLPRLTTTRENASLVFWDVLGLPLRAQLQKSGTNRLTVELLPGYRPPGDRAVYLRDDGRVDVL
ncbi:MAG: hypothetical protein AAGF24_07015 [Cyanobacteria bacterium P01_H01_bin.121]